MSDFPEYEWQKVTYKKRRERERCKPQAAMEPERSEPKYWKDVCFKTYTNLLTLLKSMFYEQSDTYNNIGTSTPSSGDARSST